MESPVAARFFRQLFVHQTFQPCRRWPAVHCSARHGATSVRRAAGTYSRLKKSAETKADDRSTAVNWVPRKDLQASERETEYREYEMVTAAQLRQKARRPRHSKMLMRDFIEDSLYNPYYGYFSSQATIFDPGPYPFDFPSLPSEAAFNSLLDQKYTEFEDALDAVKPNDTRQLWHTPTELFRPHYAEAMARYLVENYKLALYPYHDLIIYELGAGNGTFMLNVLDWIREMEPRVYERTRYRVIEISAALAARQSDRITSVEDYSGANHESDSPEDHQTPAERIARTSPHAAHVEIINTSIHEWNTYVPDPCFIVALEVIDNFGHDAIKYDLRTHEPRQSVVLIDKAGDFFEFWSPDIDPVAARFFRVRDAAGGGANRTRTQLLGRYAQGVSNSSSSLISRLRRRYSGSKHKGILKSDADTSNLSETEYIPTRLMEFFDILARYFPAHKLLLSDFHSLPDAVPGTNAPVVQTRYRRTTVPVTTPLVRQGYFDIFFPTDFQAMESMYRALTGRLTRNITHEEFMARWAYVEETRCRNGENPLLTWYQNASVMLTV